MHMTYIHVFGVVSVLRGELNLHEAARNNDVEKVKELLAQKTNVNSKNNVSMVNNYTPCSPTTLIFLRLRFRFRRCRV